MIGNLTKDQIANLPEEQQEMIARVVLDESRNRRLTLAKAKGYWGFRLVPMLLWMGAILTCIWTRDLSMALPYLLLGLFVLIQFHVFGINSRIDAVFTLMNVEGPNDSTKQTEHGIAESRSSVPTSESTSSVHVHSSGHDDV